MINGTLERIPPKEDPQTLHHSASVKEAMLKVLEEQASVLEQLAEVEELEKLNWFQQFLYKVRKLHPETSHTQKRIMMWALPVEAWEEI